MIFGAFAYLCAKRFNMTLNPKKTVESGRQTLRTEAEALLYLAGMLDESFARAVDAIMQTGGRLVVSGIGKSALVARKMVATFNSTGTPAVFLHAADATHGDMGIIQENDLVLILSKSGNTPEIKLLASLVKNAGFRLMAMTADPESHLARAADIVLLTPVDREADPLNLAPTTSSTLQMALGDALAVAVLEQRGFTRDDFARFHPGGSLGKQLLLQVGQLLDDRDAPSVTPDTPLRDVIVEITAKRVGGTAVLDNGQVTGIITDGDVRRMLQKHTDISRIRARDIMSAHPKTTTSGTLAADALKKMKQHNINQLIVLDSETGNYLGIVHLHDILKEGIL